MFVAGPGYGEGIAVALPGGGWIVLDGCRVATGALPLLAILERWRSPGEPVEALLLTHPHADHAFGVRELIEITSPRCVGVTTSPTSPALVFAAIEAELAMSRPSSLDQLRRRIVIGAMLAIRRRFEVAPAELIALVDGTRISAERSRHGSIRPGTGGSARTRSPEPRAVRRSQRAERRGRTHVWGDPHRAWQ